MNNVLSLIIIDLGIYSMFILIATYHCIQIALTFSERMSQLVTYLVRKRQNTTKELIKLQNIL